MIKFMQLLSFNIYNVGMNKVFRCTLPMLLATAFSGAFAQTAFINGDHPHNEGWVESRDADVHGRFEAPVPMKQDWRKPHKPFFVDQPKQRAWATFQEEVEYKAWLLMSMEGEKMASADLSGPKKALRSHGKAARKYVSKTVLAAKPVRIVCAPEVATADTAEWRDHLLCWDTQEKRIAQ